MGQIVKLPAQASKLGYRRVKKRSKTVENPNQLDLFTEPHAQILQFTSELSCFEQALMLDERGDERAAELYTKAVEEQDCPADALCNLGIIESQKGNTIKAFDCFTNSLKHNPRHAEAHYNLGNLYFDLNDFRLAQIHYEMASQVEPTFANAFFNLALVQAINNDPSGAANSLTKHRELVSPEEARLAAETLDHITKTLVAAQNPRFSSK